MVSFFKDTTVYHEFCRGISVIEEDINSLSKRLERLERAYWLENNPLVPDPVYDQLRQRYKQLTGDERPVGYEGSAEKLPSPMYSLNNVYNESEFEKWIRKIKKKTKLEDIEFIVEPKFDGISVSLLYENGNLIKSFTRGNSIEGDRIDDKIPKNSPYFPKELNVKGKIEIRGEVIIDNRSFDKLINVDKAKYTNPRQAAVGILRGTNTTHKHYLKFICFGFGIGGEFFTSDSDILENSGPIKDSFATTPILYIGTSWTEAFAVCDRCCHSDLPEVNQYPMDGAVIKLNDIALREKLGNTSHHPRWATAVKTQNDEFETHITGVEWSLGVQGTLTPVIIISPIIVDGVTISRVTGDNAFRFNHAEYHLGDKVWVKRSGGVIPKITRHKKYSNKNALVSPKRCPSCGQHTIFNGAYLRCGNGFLCDGNTQARLLHFVSRDALDLKGFGTVAIEWCIHHRLTSGSQLLSFFRKASNDALDDAILLNGRFGEKISQKLIDVCEKRIYPLHRVLYSLAIPGVGLVTARHLAFFVKNLKMFIEIFTSGKDPVIPNVHDSTVENIKYWMDHPNVLDEILALDELLDTTVPNETSLNESIGNVCFTGSGDGFDRKMLEQSAKRIGMTPVKTITKSLDYLVCGKTGASEKKLKSAIDKKVPILSVAEWIKKTT